MVVKAPETRLPHNASSISASSRIRAASFPPSSRVTFFTVAAATAAASRPVSVEPVSDTLRTRGYSRRRRPTVEPGPVTTARRPDGNRSVMAPSARITVSGVLLAGFTMTALPASRAGTTLTAVRAKGQFQGVMAPTSPTGSWKTRSWPIPSSTTS